MTLPATYRMFWAIIQLDDRDLHCARVGGCWHPVRPEEQN